jgi:hypothetical protein
MNARKLSGSMLSLGVLVVAAALIWWAHFYSQMSKEFGGGLKGYLECIYSTSGACGFISGLASFAEVTPYSPIIFWIGAVLLIIGSLIRFSVGKETTPAPGGAKSEW